MSTNNPNSTPKLSEFNYFFENRDQLKTAVNAWIGDPDTATTTYGDIKDWDVSQVTDFSNLFLDKTDFNEDISRWDVSNGQNFGYMFAFARNFNHYIGSWNVSSDANLYKMFWWWDGVSRHNIFTVFPESPTANYFNKQPLTDSTIRAAVENQGNYSITGPYGPIKHWDVSQVTNFSELFKDKTTFNEDISGWDVSKGTNFSSMFSQATSFDKDISG